MIDHPIYLSCLKHRLGIEDQVYQWIASYFQNRRRSLLIDGQDGNDYVLTCNVPQGSVLGPKFFMDYKSPLGNIINSHGLTAHFYTDDNQIYLAFDHDNYASSIAKLLECIVDMQCWIASNFLQLYY